MLQVLLAIIGFLLCLILAYLVLVWLVRLRVDKARMLDMVFLRVMIPKKDSQKDKEDQKDKEKDFKEVVGVMTHFYTALNALASGDLKNKIIGQDFFSMEYAVIDNQIFFYVVFPRQYASLMEKQITSYFPDAVIEQTKDYNIFKPDSYQSSNYMYLSKSHIFPIKTTQRLESDPLNNITNACSKLSLEEGAAIQIMLRPVVNNKWQDLTKEEAKRIHKEEKKKSLLNPIAWLGTLLDIVIHGPTDQNMAQAVDNKGMSQITPLTQEKVKAMEEKAAKVGFDVIIRLVTSAPTKHQADIQLANIRGAFEQYADSNLNSFRKTKYHSHKFLVRNFLYRSFNRPFWCNLYRMLFQVREWNQIMSAEELAAIYHFPNIRFNNTPSIKWQDFKIAPPPHNLPKEGLLLAHSIFRGETKDVRIKRDDRRRHFYAIGKSGTGKSTILEYMIRQDLQNGEGVCVVDPHGDLVEAVLPYIPRSRADDVILFDPGDLQRPLGLNMLEAYSQDQKEFVAQEALAIFIKMFGEEIMGPRLQHYFRNGVLTLMEDDEEGATLIDLPRLFTDDPYQQYKASKVKNPVVKSFWDKEMASSGAREKQEMIPYFSSKFGPFLTNMQIRNIIGQTKSGFDFRDVMDNQKILLVNLSKGKLGDINSQLLGMIIVAKIQMAAMSRVDTAEKDRKDFYLYVDEFQNFVTDSFASILSEARKYRLNLIVAHQYISQITKMKVGGKGTTEDTTIRDAVFGNVGSMMCFKIGSQDAEVMAKEFAPVFSEQDLINIANYQAYIKLNIDNATSRAFSMKTIYDPTGADKEAVQAFKQLSRLKYGREKSFVDREIARRVT